jgi:putative chitinase
MSLNKLKSMFSKPAPAKPAPVTPPEQVAPPPPITVTPEPRPVSVGGLQDAGAFYDQIRITKLYGPVFSATEFQGMEEILKDCKKAKWPIAYVAYALATAYHETAGTMQPIKEYGGRSYYMKLYDVTGQNPERARKMGNTAVGDGALYCGRGYVQLTWKVNYAKAAAELGVDLITNPDLAMNPDIASDVMIKGMEQGWFTGKRLATYLPPTGKATLQQFTDARRIINSTDKAAKIAEEAMAFQEALEVGHWA